MDSRVSISYLIFSIWCLLFISLNADPEVSVDPAVPAEETETATEKEFVLTLDHSNFHDTISKHDFIVVEFYAPWCGHCKSLAPEYEKAASILSSHEPPVALAKVNADEELNKDLAAEYEVKGYPTIKILRNKGKNIQDFNGPREAEGIVEYLKKQSGPASAEIKSADDAGSVVVDKKISIVGVFPKFIGEEFEKFMALAEKLRSDYEFGHTLDAKHLPRGESSVSGPLIRLFKPFDELFLDSKDFDLDAMTKFIEVSSVPLVTEFTNDPSSHAFVMKFFNGPNAKAMLFMNLSSADAASFTSRVREVAEHYKNNDISFLVGDLEASQGAFQYFGLKEDQVPLMVVQTNDASKFLKANLKPDDIAPWIKDYLDGKVDPFKKSQAIPETNDEPVKVVVADTLQDIVYKSGKNVLIEFYAPWCGHCKKLAPILDEVAIHFESDPSVVIAKLDATENDVVGEDFDVKGYPTLYFRSASGKITSFEGDRSKEAIIEFIETTKDKSETETTKVEEKVVNEESTKDEL